MFIGDLTTITARICDRRDGVQRPRCENSELPRMVKRRPRHPHRKSTAYHEAGHAVIARVLTLASGPATIKPDYDEGTAGFSITDVNSCDAEWEKRGKARFLDAAWHVCIVS